MIQIKPKKDFTISGYPAFKKDKPVFVPNRVAKSLVAEGKAEEVKSEVKKEELKDELKEEKKKKTEKKSKK